jgi:hypothetical protein
MREQWAPLPDLKIVERRLRRLFEDVGAAPSVTLAADVHETGIGKGAAKPRNVKILEK